MRPAGVAGTQGTAPWTNRNMPPHSQVTQLACQIGRWRVPDTRRSEGRWSSAIHDPSSTDSSEHSLKRGVLLIYARGGRSKISDSS